MGLLDIFRQKAREKNAGESRIERAFESARRQKNAWADSSSITPDERPYYQPDEYYVFETHPGSPMNQKVVTFEERRKSSHPSRGGLYVAEIMLLAYCEKGKYPKPKGGYPGFWWFKYGIRNVGGALKSLEERGFIALAPKARCLKDFKVAELRDLLKREGLPSTGRKDALIERIAESVPEDRLPVDDASRKYELTELGVSELEENGYVPYMHSHKRATVEGLPSDLSFTVWDINRLFPNGVKGDWRPVVGRLEKQRFGIDMASHATKSGKLVKADSVSAEIVLKTLEEKSDYISSQIHSPGDGFDEASRGYDCKAIGEDAEALVQFYIAIGKKFDAPAVYNEASTLLHKYGLDSEAIEVLASGLKNVSKDNTHWRELLEKRDRLLKAKGKGR